MKTKIGTEVAHTWGSRTWLGYHFQGQKVKGQLARGRDILWWPPTQTYFWEIFWYAA